MVKEEIPDADIRVIDSRNLSSGSGHLVLLARELANSGLSAADIEDRLNKAKNRLDVSFVLQTLEYLQKGGRCPSVVAFGANLLKLRPEIEVREGKMGVAKKYRGSMEKSILDYVRGRLAGREDIDTKRIFITHSHVPQEIVDKINAVGFWSSIPLWAVTLLGGLFITVLAFIMILTVYSRMFKLYMYTAIAPIPMSSFAGEPPSNVGKNFLRSYAGVCLEGAIIALACVIFSIMAASPPAIDPDVSVVTAVWSYVGELIFNLLVLVGAVRMSDRIVKELLGL